mgnify:CR=1 FL=1
MVNIPVRIENRIVSNIKNIQSKAKKAKELDVSEAQTISAVIKPFLTEVLGYDEFDDLTDQFVVRGTYCDLAVKCNGKPYMMVEAKAVGVTLKDAHAKQAKDYGLNSGVQWIVLTNGLEWNIYKIIFKQPVVEELVMSFNIANLNLKKDEDKKKIFYLCKEAAVKSEIDNLYAEKLATNKYIVGNLLFKKEVVNFIKKELRKMFPDTNIEPEAIMSILSDDVIRREIQETPEAAEAKKKIERIEKRQNRLKEKKICKEKEAS